ncbi:MAG TPA: acyltransferase [Pyrinomonadaceae bacterium]|nr:acyltransferase [Pyrinomonadaceae bacterium]
MEIAQELPASGEVKTDRVVADVRSKRFYHPEIDVLRFFAFFIVFIHHTFPSNAQTYLDYGLSPALAHLASSVVLSGGLGVDIFLVLSSYLITELFIRESAEYGRVNVRAFYFRRALRIWPLYYGFLALLILTPGSAGGYLDLKYTLTFLLFAGNWACAWWGYPPSAAAPLWSVSIEEQFYLLWPLVINAFGIKRIVQVSVAMLFIAFGARLVLIIADTKPPGIWCNTFARLDPIACGALLAVSLRGAAPSIRKNKRVIMCLAGATLFVVVSGFTRTAGWSSLIFFPAVAVGSVLIFLSCLSATMIKNRWSAALIYLGRISYGLYVFHLLALTIAARWSSFSNEPTRLAAKFLLGAILTLLFAVVSYEVFEKYFLRLKEKYARVPSRPL